jgi:DNA-binding NtrC family response regulator
MPRILFIDKEDRSGALLQCRLKADGVKIKFAPSLEAAWEKLSSRKFDLILWNTVNDPAAEINLRETLKLLATKVCGSRIVVLGNSEALEASRLRCGNVQVDNLPADEEDLLALVQRNLPLKVPSERNNSSADKFALPIEFEGIIAVSLPMGAVLRRAIEAANVDMPVLITGETGTGKDLIAAAIHKRSRRKDNPYIIVNTGAMSPQLIASEIFGHEKGAFTGAQEAHQGIFEQAQGGTVFLDEIATMDEKTQVSLLRVLEEKTFHRVGGIKKLFADVRIIAATNEDLEKNVAEKRFREDLFYRLNVLHISVPPLRERPGAITVLTDHFLSHFAPVFGKEIERVAPETYKLLRRYRWPGNVRELKNVIQAALLMLEGKELTPEFIPERIRDAALASEGGGEPTCSFRVGASLHTVEQELIRLTVTYAGGNKKLAASILGISRRALYNKLKKHG